MLVKGMGEHPGEASCARAQVLPCIIFGWQPATLGCANLLSERLRTVAGRVSHSVPTFHLRLVCGCVDLSACYNLLRRSIINVFTMVDQSRWNSPTPSSAIPNRFARRPCLCVHLS